MQEIPGPPSTQADSGGAVIGRYRCEECLGQSAGIETWRARVQGRAGFDQVFALHCLAPGLLARRPKAAESLLVTARRVALIKDERFAAIAEAGLAPGSAFVASEFVHGVSLDVLSERLAARIVPRPDPAAWGMLLGHVGYEMASALAAAHAGAAPVVHGTLAPASVRVTPQGAIKIVDYGFRTSILPPAQLPVTSSRSRYRAPEVRAGGEPTAASDLYALGALLYELATGAVPGQSNPRQPQAGHALPDEIQAPVLALIATDPDLRPSARQVATELEEALGGRGAEARAALAALVRQSERSAHATLRGAGGVPGAPSSQQDSGVYVAADEGSDFVEEPTKLLEVAADGNPASLAKILEEMRDAEASEPQVDAHARRQFSSPTPVVGVPLFDGGGATAVADVGDILRALPPDPEVDGTADPEFPPRLESDAAPAASLAEMNTAEVADPFAQPAPARPPAPNGQAGDDQAIPELVRFAEFSPGNSFSGAELTPSGWHPTVDRSGSSALDESPGGFAAIEAPPRLGRSRTLAMTMAAAGAALAAALIFILRTDDPTAAVTEPAMAPVVRSEASETEPAGGPGVAPTGAVAQDEPSETKKAQEPEVPEPAAAPAGEKPTSDPSSADGDKAPSAEPAAALAKGPASSPAPAKPNRRRAAAAMGARARNHRNPEVQSPGSTAATATPEPVAEGAAESPEPAAAAADPAPAEPNPAATQAVAPAGQEVTLDSKPSGAVVWMAGKRRGKTPLRLEVPEDATMLRLVHPGHISATVMLDSDTPASLEVPLPAAQTPEEGEAVLSVACRIRNRLLLMVDGHEIGRLCPSAQLRLVPGSHQIGVLDPATGQVHTQEITLDVGRNVLDLSP